MHWDLMPMEQISLWVTCMHARSSPNERYAPALPRNSAGLFDVSLHACASHSRPKSWQGNIGNDQTRRQLRHLQCGPCWQRLLRTCLAWRNVDVD